MIDLKQNDFPFVFTVVLYQSFPLDDGSLSQGTRQALVASGRLVMESLQKTSPRGMTSGRLGTYQSLMEWIESGEPPSRVSILKANESINKLIVSDLRKAGFSSFLDDVLVHTFNDPNITAPDPDFDAGTPELGLYFEDRISSSPKIDDDTLEPFLSIVKTSIEKWFGVPFMLGAREGNDVDDSEPDEFIRYNADMHRAIVDNMNLQQSLSNSQPPSVRTKNRL